jgi:competence protein ComEA
MKPSGKIKTRIKDYFTFSSAERNGVIALLCLIILIPFGVSTILNRKTSVPTTDSLFNIEAENFLNSIRIQEGTDSYREVHHVKSSDFSKGQHFKPFRFDPNTATLSDYVEMGFTEKQALTIIKYRNKGGTFSKREDFARLYVVDEKTYKIFEPYIFITPVYNSLSKPSTTEASTLSKESISSESVLIEINAADSLQLLSIKGIGPVFASRIIKYRKLIGGFATKEQLREVYGIDSLRYAEISRQVVVDTTLIHKIRINEVTLPELQKHPYVNYYTAKAIIDKRIQTGRYTSFTDLENAIKGKREQIKKLKPYLQF